MPDLRVLTNIPNPYNGALYDSLNSIGCDTQVFYKSLPAHEGRTWDLPLHSYEQITTRRGDVRFLLRHPAQHTILSGGYHRQRDILRLAAGAASKTNLVFWGERLRSRPSAAHMCWVQRAVFRPFSSVLAVGSWARASYANVIMRGVPVHTFPYGLPSPTQLSARDDQPVVGYAGALIKRKGVADFLRAVAAMKRLPRIEIVGTGPLRQALGILGERLDLHITWFGEVGKHQLDSIRSKWWAQVVPSLYDGWGMVVPEALVAGVPVVATNRVGAARDLILPGVTGELTYSLGDLAPAIDRVLEPNYQQHLAGAAKVLGAELLADRGATWLSSLLADRPPAPQSFIDDALARARRLGVFRTATQA